MWTAGFGGSQTTDGNAAVGSKRRDQPDRRHRGRRRLSASRRYTIAGFALAGGGTCVSTSPMASAAAGPICSRPASSCAPHHAGAAYISRPPLAYGWQDITTDRTVTLAGLDQLQARFNANAFSGRVEGGYRFVGPWIGGIGITPYAAAQFTTFDLPAYAEQALIGTNNFALAYGAKGDDRSRAAKLGFRAPTRSLYVRRWRAEGAARPSRLGA